MSETTSNSGRDGGFEAHFEQYIKPKLSGLEDGRINARAASRKRLLVAAFGILALVAIVLFLRARFDILKEFGLFESAILVLFVGGSIYAWVRRPRSRHIADRKQAIIPEILKFAGDFRYRHDGKIAEDILNNSRLFGYWDKYESEDLITGSYFGRRFQFAEVTLTDTRGEDEDVEFNGCLVFLEMTSARGLTVATKHKGKISKFWDRTFRSTKNLTSIDFGDAEFGENFEVHSDDEAGARALITGQLIQAMSKLGELRDAEVIEFGTNGKTFLLRIETERDLFEPARINDTALTPNDSRRFLQHVREVLNIVEVVALAMDPQDRDRNGGPSASDSRSRAQ
ncbi:MAG: hypothetical protein CMM10_12745 [Rhodospirillaceae bacterium]|jgi:hypothetical protein|nr:hypothetical protein [Rhodospirillaceae bacterium]|tara:strand:- start:1206 stop:2228 length:1023 start_codon:yes stop_codon:yes gene_type:complete